MTTVASWRLQMAWIKSDDGTSSRLSGMAFFHDLTGQSHNLLQQLDLGLELGHVPLREPHVLVLVGIDRVLGPGRQILLRLIEQGLALFQEPIPARVAGQFSGPHGSGVEEGHGNVPFLAGRLLQNRRIFLSGRGH